MTTRIAAFSAVLLAAGAIAQPNQNVITRALEPAANDLDRLNLVVAWRLYLPVESRGDAVATVQPFDDQVFVQLQSGRLIAIQAHANPKTFKRPGDVLWVYRPLQHPGAIQPLAVGPTEVYVTQDLKLLILDRFDGKLKYTEEMESTATNAPAVDETAIYIPQANRQIVSYSLVQKVPGYRPPKPYEAPDPVHKLSLAVEPAEALSTPQNRSPSIARLDILRPPFHRGTDTIDVNPSVGMLKNIRPPYREVDSARSPSVAKLYNLRDIYEQSNKEAVTRIMFLWRLLAGGRVDDTPVLTYDPNNPDSETLTTSTGRIVLTASRHALRTNVISTEFIAEARVTAPLVAQGDSLYIATADSNLISVSLRDLRESSMAANSLPRGKFTTGGPVMQKPLVTDDSLYVVGERWGLIRLKRDTLEPMWTERLPDGRIRPKHNPDVVQVLAVSPRTRLGGKPVAKDIGEGAKEAPEAAKELFSNSYVYALDRQGKMLVIDAERGATLSSFDVSAFTRPVTNDKNDRLYLASNNGLLLCMHDRLKVVPVLLQKPPVKMAPEPPPEVEPKKGPEVPEAKAPAKK
jgi:hypothetical protein